MKNLPKENNHDKIERQHGGINVDLPTMVAQIDLTENATYIVSGGQIVKGDMPVTGFGDQTITWQNGKPTHQKVSYTNKI